MTALGRLLNDGLHSEAVLLWIGTAIVVVIASLIHFVVASSAQRELRERAKFQLRQHETDDLDRAPDTI